MIHQITGRTRLGGLLGSPVSHSISPMMHNDSFYELGLDCVYLCFDVGQEKLGNVVNALRDMNTYGFNLTMPNKEAVLPYLDELSLAARIIGAVNTVKNENGKLVGYMTDVADNEALRELLSSTALLTNATSVGMSPNKKATPLQDVSLFHPGLTVSDVIYHPRETRLLAEARAAGCKTFNGMYMLLYQGEAAFKIWTGQDMPTELIKKRYF